MYDRWQVFVGSALYELCHFSGKGLWIVLDVCWRWFDAACCQALVFFSSS